MSLKINPQGRFGSGGYIWDAKDHTGKDVLCIIPINDLLNWLMLGTRDIPTNCDPYLDALRPIFEHKHQVEGAVNSHVTVNYPSDWLAAR